jgi:transcriptional regulator with XRE-family HTH domain
MRLLSAMTLNGYSISKLATEIGINQLTLSRKINGIRNFTELDMFKISKILQCKVTDIFFNTELPNEQQTAK